MYIINLSNNILPVKFAACISIHGVNTYFVNTVLTPHWNIKYFQKFCDFYLVKLLIYYQFPTFLIIVISS